VASLACGLAASRGQLIGARAVQGLGGAVVSAVAASLTLNLFPEMPERAKALSLFGLVGGAGGCVALLLGGTVTSALNWHWIFLINLPVGAAVYALGLAWLPKDRGTAKPASVDVMGAATVTTSVMIALYAIVSSQGQNRAPLQALTLLACAAVLLVIFLRVEARVPAPILPLRLFQQRNLVIANFVAVLLAIASFAWYFISTLYLQLVLQYSPWQVSLAFLPANLILAAFSLGLSARLVIRFGIKLPLITGSLLTAAGLMLFARAPIDGHVVVDVLPGMLLLGLGIGLASTPMLLAGTGGAPPDQSGLVCGVINTSSLMGGAIGLAILASIAAARTSDFPASALSLPDALNSGYHLAFYTGAVFAGLAALAAKLLKVAESGGRP
jgi:MFS family permease